MQTPADLIVRVLFLLIIGVPVAAVCVFFFGSVFGWTAFFWVVVGLAVVFWLAWKISD
jgi:hypothetical protein